MPEPDRYVVTRWKHKPLAGMAYSYLPVGTSGQLYDVMAAPVGDRLFFAGEVCSRFSVSSSISLFYHRELLYNI